MLGPSPIKQCSVDNDTRARATFKDQYDVFLERQYAPDLIVFDYAYPGGLCLNFRPSSRTCSARPSSKRSIHPATTTAAS